MTTATEQAASRPEPGLRDGELVDPGWLAGHLHDADLRVVEVDVSPAAYESWHIDGAVLWNVYADLKDVGYHTVDAAALERLVARSGIGPDSTVVFYGYAPVLGLWLMKLYGHPDVRILDCSNDAWRAGGHPWTPPERTTGQQLQPGRPGSPIRAGRVAVQDAINQPGTTWSTCAHRPSTGGIALALRRH